MNSKVISLLLMASLFLVACGESESKPESSKATKSNQVTQSEKGQKEAKAETTTQLEEDSEQFSESVSETKSESIQATDASFNGSYYSVQGKYGEVIIANKKHPVSASYAPGENPTALSAFQTLIADMQAKGFSVSNSYSGFRSYETQASIYSNYVASDGQANADRYSARAGYSEHQTGLAFDLLDGNGQLLTESTASDWLAKHAHEYGFIVRYLPGKEYSTGYMPESWHVRYIGKEATDIYQSGQTLEEYFGISGGDYAQ
ncbi:LD-carboxypeptidase LdcB/DacB [Streptococcus sp. S784/96/1]|uniref:LD-carboxypeptidase LdcB/DacB n=1 Tax=Streptococcus sp. S784/96/1 TaxID=2653499 RepID=UPI0013868F52|nr:LD-carboxypeptidase LdcB/DacB [Streptococcus sp. S784/96/1]